MHQFRIEPAATGSAKPTPEGMHHDGAKWIYISMVGRSNIKDDVTTIVDKDGRFLVSFTLKDPFDTVFVDDRRVKHGVSPINRIDSSQPAHRDVLVLTFNDG